MTATATTGMLESHIFWHEVTSFQPLLGAHRRQEVTSPNKKSHHHCSQANWFWDTPQGTPPEPVFTWPVWTARTAQRAQRFCVAALVCPRRRATLDAKVLYITSFLNANWGIIGKRVNSLRVQSKSFLRIAKSIQLGAEFLYYRADFLYYRADFL